ncbi:DUF2474 domain-containing protein [Geminicoccaceae bacterium 1502E]|nr:DUF2474 domain-containing protein [Geminicoccaceae bacterium 1502E]
MGGRSRRLAWFVGLWLAGVAGVAALAALLRLLLLGW